MRSARACWFITQSRRSHTMDRLTASFASPRKSSIGAGLPQAKQQEHLNPHALRLGPRSLDFLVLRNLVSTQGVDHGPPRDEQVARAPGSEIRHAGNGFRPRSDSAPGSLMLPGAGPQKPASRPAEIIHPLGRRSPTTRQPLECPAFPALEPRLTCGPPELPIESWSARWFTQGPMQAPHQANRSKLRLGGRW